MRNRRSGFTLVEMLVVIGIMAALIGILAPTIMNAWQSANRTKLNADLQSLATALDARKADFGDYPRVTTSADGWDGARVLCQSLIMPGDPDDLDDDNNDGNPLGVGELAALGARRRPGGRVFPPYIDVDKFRMKHPTDPAITDPTTLVVMDSYDKPILYFPASLASPNVRVAGGYVTRGEFSRYDANDNFEALRIPGEPDPIVLKRIRLMLGDFNDNGTVDAGETPVEVPFLLWSAGPDDVYGPQAKDSPPDAVLDEKDVDECDDATNFR